ncbi:MAG: glycosyltransferase N-terminal domain-containing protein [Planctomycetaceae bacterium]
MAKEKFPEHTVCYFPLDFTWAVKRALARIRPSAVVLVELELWPNFILAASRMGIPLVLANGRISERSFRGYRRIKPLMRSLLTRFHHLGAQNETYAARLVALGAVAESVTVTGSIKFDHIETDRQNSQTRTLRKAFGLRSDEPVFIAGSTQAPEEQYAIDAWQEATKTHPRLRLILVPRHKERFEEVASLVMRLGLPLVRRSDVSSGTSGDDSASQRTPVLLLDTLGELSACWGLADVAFVGGSLTKRGGQNMIEPAAYGAAVLFGPNTWNFRNVVELLLDEAAASVVADADTLTRKVGELLDDPIKAQAQGQIAQRLVLAQQGATARTVDLVIDALPGVMGRKRRRAA